MKNCCLDEVYEKLRIVRNLVENKAYNNVNDYSDGIKAIADIMSFENVLVALMDESNEIKHFEKVQVVEERNKSQITFITIPRFMERVDKQS